MGNAASEEFEKKAQQAWGVFTDQYGDFPALWIRRLITQVDFWLDGQEFEVLQFGHNDRDVEESTELTVFGLTEHFVLYIKVTKPALASRPTGTPDWQIVRRSDIDSLEVDYATTPWGRRTPVIEAGFRSLPGKFTFPDAEDLDVSNETRRAIFLGLRDDYLRGP